MTHVPWTGWRRARKTWMAGAVGLVLSVMTLPASPSAAAHAASSAPARAIAGTARDVATCNGQAAPWMDTRLSPDQRAKLLVANMITFPSSETDVPANTPQQWPGVNGVATYSEGLNVGYRYDDATGQTPLFPFGFGLSYTTFAFGHLRVLGGHGGQVEITAQVTNTGSRTGTEVAQLCVGDPASIGEPPRQLRGFQQVTLRPGQSETVRFTLTGPSVAYWDTATSTWAVAPGTYQVYVGDSSSLANLPLQGRFTLPASAG